MCLRENKNKTSLWTTFEYSGGIRNGKSYKWKYVARSWFSCMLHIFIFQLLYLNNNNKVLHLKGEGFDNAYLAFFFYLFYIFFYLI